MPPIRLIWSTEGADIGSSREPSPESPPPLENGLQTLYQKQKRDSIRRGRHVGKREGELIKPGRRLRPRPFF